LKETAEYAVQQGRQLTRKIEELRFEFSSKDEELSQTKLKSNAQEVSFK